MSIFRDPEIIVHESTVFFRFREWSTSVSWAVAWCNLPTYSTDCAESNFAPYQDSVRLQIDIYVYSIRPAAHTVKSGSSPTEKQVFDKGLHHNQEIKTLRVLQITQVNVLRTRAIAMSREFPQQEVMNGVFISRGMGCLERPQLKRDFARLSFIHHSTFLPVLLGLGCCSSYSFETPSSRPVIVPHTMGYNLKVNAYAKCERADVSDISHTRNCFGVTRSSETTPWTLWKRNTFDGQKWSHASRQQHEEKNV